VRVTITIDIPDGCGATVVGVQPQPSRPATPPPTVAPAGPSEGLRSPAGSAGRESDPIGHTADGVAAAGRPTTAEAVAALAAVGVTGPEALAAEYAPERILAVIGAIGRQPRPIRNPAGWVRRALRAGWTV